MIIILKILQIFDFFQLFISEHVYVVLNLQILKILRLMRKNLQIFKF